MKIKTLLLTLGIMITLTITSQTVQAAEFTVTETSAILYTNTNTVLLSNADVSKVVTPLQAGLPVQVTGVTSNGYFRIVIDGITYYVVGVGLQANTTLAIQESVSSSGWTQEKVYDTLMYLKATKYPPGFPWDWGEESCKYMSTDGHIHMREIDGNEGFSLRLMKEVFGENIIPREYVTADISPIKIGDALFGLAQHTGTVVGIDDKYVSLVTGNTHYNKYNPDVLGVVDWDTKKVPIEDFFHGYYTKLDGSKIDAGPMTLMYWTAY